MALYVSFSHRRIHNDLVPVQFGLRIFPTGTFLGLIEKQLHIQSIQSVASCVPKLFKILIKINMRVLMIFLLSFSFFYVGWGADKKKPFYLGRLAHLLFITFIILYVFIIITIIIYALQAMESRWRCQDFDFFKGGGGGDVRNSERLSEFYFNPLDSTSTLILRISIFFKQATDFSSRLHGL